MLGTAARAWTLDNASWQEAVRRFDRLLRGRREDVSCAQGELIS
jgi:hypothetical protein